MSLASNYLTHFISGNDDEEAYQKFFNIIYERQLKGSTNLIKGGHNCICFTEHNVNEKFPFEKTRYKKFGLSFNKQLIYKLGGEKVIYGKEEEYYKLPQSMKWRHQLHSPPTVDFSWENEVRLNKDYIDLEVIEFQLLVPDTAWADRFYDEYTNYPDDLDFSMVSILFIDK